MIWFCTNENFRFYIRIETHEIVFYTMAIIYCILVTIKVMKYICICLRMSQGQSVCTNMTAMVTFEKFQKSGHLLFKPSKKYGNACSSYKQLVVLCKWERFFFAMFKKL